MQEGDMYSLASQTQALCEGLVSALYPDLYCTTRFLPANEMA